MGDEIERLHQPAEGREAEEPEKYSPLAQACGRIEEHVKAEGEREGSEIEIGMPTAKARRRPVGQLAD